MLAPMRLGSLSFLFACQGLAACASGAPVAAEPGPPPAVDAGCGLACRPPPDAGECLPAGARCVAGGDCCIGLACDGGSCLPPPSPCPPGEQPLASGCGCDPSLAPGLAGGCPAGAYCGTDLACHLPSDGGPSDVPTPAPVGAPCDPAAAGPDGGLMPACLGVDGGAPVVCLPDPSGQSLYLCQQTCLSNADCPLPWQACPIGGGSCAEVPCTQIPATPSEVAEALSSVCRLRDGGFGICLPFSAEAVVPSGAAATETFGLCVQAGTGALGDACAEPPRRGASATALCDDGHVCWGGRCRVPCDAAPEPGDGGASDAGCGPAAACEPLLWEPLVPGARPVAGGCVPRCELDGGCDGGFGDAGSPAGDGGGDQ